MDNPGFKFSRWNNFTTWAHLFLVGIKRRMVVGCRAVLVDGENRVLLVRHSYVPGWHFPGGGVEPGETAEEASRREAEEETGLHLDGPMQFLGLYLNIDETTNRDHIAVFVSRSFTPIREFRRSAEIAEIGWFAFDALPSDTEPGTVRRVAELAEGGDARSGHW